MTLKPGTLNHRQWAEKLRGSQIPNFRKQYGSKIDALAELKAVWQADGQLGFFARFFRARDRFHFASSLSRSSWGTVRTLSLSNFVASV